jgi:hypothetical protein
MAVGTLFAPYCARNVGLKSSLEAFMGPARHRIHVEGEFRVILAHYGQFTYTSLLSFLWTYFSE